MRVSQIQNLTWAGNVLVLGCVVWVGLHFWRVKVESAKPVPEPGWKQAKTDDVGKQRWPGERSAYDDIHKTPIGGKVPPPPVVTKEPVKIDRTQEFRNKLKYLSGVQFPSSPERSLARVSYDGKEIWVRPGDDLGGFRLIEFSLSPAKAAAAAPGKPALKDEAKIARMVFRNPDAPEPLVIEQPEPPAQALVSTGDKLVMTLQDLEAIKLGRSPLAGPLKNPAFQQPDGDWVITEDEQLWIEVWGDKHVLPNLGTKPETDADGNPRGVRITSLPESKTPLAPSHGIVVDDVIRSINGVPVNSKEEIVEYLRGPGKGLAKYTVVIEKDGAERTVVYRVPRPAKASRD
jgi:hypothetical protein